MNEWFNDGFEFKDPVRLLKLDQVLIELTLNIPGRYKYFFVTEASLH